MSHGRSPVSQKALRIWIRKWKTCVFKPSRAEKRSELFCSNQKAKSIFFGGHSSNHSLLFSYSSHCFPFLCAFIFLSMFSLRSRVCVSFSFSFLSLSRIGPMFQCICKTLFHSLHILYFLFYIFHLCIVIFFRSFFSPLRLFDVSIICVFFFSLLFNFSLLSQPISILADYCHYPRIWTYSVVIIQVSAYVSTCPFGIRFNAIARYRNFIHVHIHTWPKPKRYSQINDLSLFWLFTIYRNDVLWNSIKTMGPSTWNKKRMRWHQIRSGKLNNFQKIFNVQFANTGLLYGISC